MDALAIHYNTDKPENIFVEYFTKIRESARLSNKDSKKIEATICPAEPSEEDSVEYIEYDDSLDNDFNDTVE